MALCRCPQQTHLVGLITRRSRVQIPPPLRVKALVRAISDRGFFVSEAKLLTDLLTKRVLSRFMLDMLAPVVV